MYFMLPVARQACDCRAVIMYISSIQQRVCQLKPLVQLLRTIRGGSCILGEGFKLFGGEEADLQKRSSRVWLYTSRGMMPITARSRSLAGMRWRASSLSRIQPDLIRRYEIAPDLPYVGRRRGRRTRRRRRDRISVGRVFAEGAEGAVGRARKRSVRVFADRDRVPFSGKFSRTARQRGRFGFWAKLLNPVEAIARRNRGAGRRFMMQVVGEVIPPVLVLSGKFRWWQGMSFSWCLGLVAGVVGEDGRGASFRTVL